MMNGCNDIVDGELIDIHARVVKIDTNAPNPVSMWIHLEDVYGELTTLTLFEDNEAAGYNWRVGQWWRLENVKGNRYNERMQLLPTYSSSMDVHDEPPEAATVDSKYPHLLSRPLPPEDCAEHFAVFDIETTGRDGTQDNVVAIAVGCYDLTMDYAEVQVFTFAGEGDELTLIRNSYTWLENHCEEGVVTYNGVGFDVPFLEDRITALLPMEEEGPTLNCMDRHLDLFLRKKEFTTTVGSKWPTLEECLAAYNIPVQTVYWEGEELTNKRFGEYLAPRYLQAIEEDDRETIERLEKKIIEYAAGDIEATVALHEADARRSYLPDYTRFER
jgi:hypothetical protein